MSEGRVHRRRKSYKHAMNKLAKKYNKEGHFISLEPFKQMSKTRLGNLKAHIGWGTYYPDLSDYRVGKDVATLLREFIESKVLNLCRNAGNVAIYAKKKTLTTSELKLVLSIENCDEVMFVADKDLEYIKGENAKVAFASSQIKALIKLGSGIPRVSEEAIDLVRRYIIYNLNIIVDASSMYVTHAKRRTISTEDIKHAITVKFSRTVKIYN